MTRYSDNLWLRLLDVSAALEARSYDAAGQVVLDMTDPMCPWNESRWLLGTGPDGSRCQPTSAREAGLALGVDVLGSLYLGGVTPAVLAAAGRVVELHPGALTTLSRQFRSDSAPYNAVRF